MDAETVPVELLEEGGSDPPVAAALPDTLACGVVEQLKAEADRYWGINANRSLELAEMILQIGESHADRGQQALGMMARGDALRLLGRTQEAWDALERAADLFQAAGDEIGWARTRIGRLMLCTELNRVPEALSAAERAREIFARHGEYEKRLRLDLNTALVHNYLGEHRRALALFDDALAMAEALGDAGRKYLGLLYTNIGYAWNFLGDFRAALAHHEHALVLFEEHAETSNAAVAEWNIAYIAQAQGQYRRALQLLHHVLEIRIAEELPLDAADAMLDMVECYLALNRYTDARDLALRVVADYRTFGVAYRQGLALLHLATAEAALAEWAAAKAALDAAEPIFDSLGARAWSATTRLRRGRLALRHGDAESASREAAAAAAFFNAAGREVDYAAAVLLGGESSFTIGDLGGAGESGKIALRIAQRRNVAPLRYTTHLLLGRVSEARGDVVDAVRRYRAAAATVERMQRSLTITLRPGFLEDKGEALRALIGLHLRGGDAERAFETLERAKSQALLSYLANREQLRWAGDDPRSRSLLAELDRLRAEHHWFYRLAHDRPIDGDTSTSAPSPEAALAEIRMRERSMRAITERLYLRAGDEAFARTPSPSIRDLQKHLPRETLLIEYYNDGVNLWAFTLDGSSLQAHPLPLAVRDVDRLLVQLQVNLSAAIQAGASSCILAGLTNLGHRILQRLYAGLIEPLTARLHERRRLVVVPYGALHYLPFHLLYDGSVHLIDRYEVVVLPAAGLATRRGPSRTGGALVLAHSWDGRLPQTLVEAEIVRDLFGGAAVSEEEARRLVLGSPPRQILHIAAHGEYRLDQPDLSYIQLADGQLFTDDLLQTDLSYELVTLSACETGRANVAAGDELIGLGRGFLYAGAGALIVSLWRVGDASTVTLMGHVYRALRSGTSKAAALRDAQLQLRAGLPRLHPAFWGAFQLVGDAEPLSANLPTRS